MLSVVSLLMVAAPLDPQHGVNSANLDRSCAPCTDFNQFANGSWMAKNPIPSRLPGLGRR